MLLSMNEGERFRLTQQERIRGEKRIETLFTHGSSFMAYPFRVVWLKGETRATTSVSLLVSIPKKRLKRAVDRNRMKRLTREAYRLHKQSLTGVMAACKGRLDVALVYVKDEPGDFVTVEKGVVRAIRELGRTIQKTDG